MQAAVGQLMLARLAAPDFNSQIGVIAALLFEMSLGADRAKGYCLPERGWMLEYSRGSIPSMLPFGLADTLFSTLDTTCTKNTLKQYGGMVVKELLQGKF